LSAVSESPARQTALLKFSLQHESDKGFRGVRVFGEVERQDWNRELQFGRLATGPTGISA